MSIKVPPAVLIRLYCEQRGYPLPVVEFKFAAPVREWAFDFAWLDIKTALEVEGGMFGMGKKCALCGRRSVAGHSSIDRTMRDKDKYNEAAFRGWRVLRCRPDEIQSGKANVIFDRLFAGA